MLDMVVFFCACALVISVGAQTEQQQPHVIPLLVGSLANDGVSFDVPSVTLISHNGVNIMVDTPANTDIASRTTLLECLLPYILYRVFQK